MNAYLFAAAAAVTLLVAGCQKYEGPTQATGTVVDRATGQPVANAYVEVGSVNSGWNGGSGSQPGTRADAAGRFALTFEAQAGKQYTLFAYTPSGYRSGYGDCPLLEAGHKNERLLVKAAAPAWVKVNCVDDPPANEVGLITSGYSGSGDDQRVGPGNFSFVRPALSYYSGFVLWETIGTDAQGQMRSGKEAFTTTRFDTATVTIHF